VVLLHFFLFVSLCAFHSVLVWVVLNYLSVCSHFLFCILTFCAQFHVCLIFWSHFVHYLGVVFLQIVHICIFVDCCRFCRCCCPDFRLIAAAIFVLFVLRTLNGHNSEQRNSFCGFDVFFLRFGLILYDCFFLLNLFGLHQFEFAGFGVFFCVAT